MSDEEATTIRLKKSVVEKLKCLRRYPGETYDEDYIWPDKDGEGI